MRQMREIEKDIWLSDNYAVSGQLAVADNHAITRGHRESDKKSMAYYFTAIMATGLIGFSALAYAVCSGLFLHFLEITA